MEPSALRGGQVPRVLCISGSDSGGGAGLQAELKTCTVFGVFGCNAVTAVTAQNTRGVFGIHAVPPEFVVAQMDAVLGDVGADVAKTGMLSTRAVIVAVAARLAAEIGRGGLGRGVVIDPVAVAAGGDALLEEDAVGAIRDALLPLATVATPNRFEAGLLLGAPAPATLGECRAAAKALADRFCRGGCVLVKGARLGAGESLAADRAWFGPPFTAGDAVLVDVLYDAAGQTLTEYACAEVATRNTHGTGCTFSAGIASALAGGDGAAAAVRRAKAYVDAAVRASAGLAVGSGARGPLDHAAARAPPAPR